jgi:uncharacterized protein (TIGR02246 family)
MGGGAMLKLGFSMLLIASLSALAAPQSMTARAPTGEEEIKKEILKLENERDQALMKNDADWFERVFADDIDYIGASGEMMTKQQVVDEIRSRTRKWQAVRHDDYKVRVYGNAAVVSYRSDSTMEYKGQVKTTLARTTDVYVKENGQWRDAVHQVTALPAQKP